MRTLIVKIKTVKLEDRKPGFSKKSFKTISNSNLRLTAIAK